MIFTLKGLCIDDALISKGSFLQTKYQCVYILIRIKGKVVAVGQVWAPSRVFADRSGAVFLLWIYYDFSVLCLLCLCARLLFVPCGHLLGSADLLALVCGAYCGFVAFPLVSWVRCGT